MSPKDCGLILLAAGRSVRFGAADKLAQDLRGTPLAFHAVAALAEVPFGARLAICSGTALDFTRRGYTVLRNDDPAAGLSGSIRIGVAAARAMGCAGVLIALADMPCVTAGLVLRLLEAADGAEAVVASSDGVRASPPAVFGAGRFEALLALDGDAGARDLIRAGRHVVAGAGELVDIDTPEELQQLNDVLRA